MNRGTLSNFLRSFKQAVWFYRTHRRKRSAVYVVFSSAQRCNFIAISGYCHDMLFVVCL